MKTCKIAVFRQADSPISIEECAIRELQEGEILVKNEYTTLCRSDISTYTGKRIEKAPTILGHEIVGKIVDIASKKTLSDACGNPLQTGDRVTWAIYAANPDSEMSKRGIPQKSPDLFKYGHEQSTPDNTLNGGLAEYTILRQYTPVIRLSEAISGKIAAIINCSVATVAGSLRLAGNLNNRKIAIWGAGMLGVIACAMCKESGAAEVIAIDINKERLVVAGQFGATQTVTASEWQNRESEIDIAIDYSGNIHSMKATIESLAIGGIAVWVGGVCPQEKIGIDSEKIIRRLSTIKGLHNYNTDDFKQAVSFIEQNYNRYPIKELIYDGFDLDHINEAFQYAIEKNPYRVGIRIN